MKRIFTFALAAMAMMGVQKASAQTEYKILSDLTSKIQNADFTADPPTTVTIRTYDYDMPDQLGAGAGGSDLFGQQVQTEPMHVLPVSSTISTTNPLRLLSPALVALTTHLTLRKASLDQALV